MLARNIVRSLKEFHWGKMTEGKQDEMYLAMMHDMQEAKKQMMPHIKEILKDMKSGKKGKMMKALANDLTADEEKVVKTEAMMLMMEAMRTDIKNRMKMHVVKKMTEDWVAMSRD